MRPAGGFGDSVAGGALERPVDRGFEIDLVTHRDENRFAVIPGAQDGSQGGIFLIQ